MFNIFALDDRSENGTKSCSKSLLRWSGAVALAVSVFLGACAEAPVKPSVAAPATVSLQEYMGQAAKATADGSREKARETYRTAANAYPASKEPWAKLSEDYFAAGDYGNAILAAQEVLLRDTTDTVASSVLAVSGLRVSASALQTLRAQNRIAGDTRSEAETMTRTLREVLGEEVLVPRPALKAGSKSRPRLHARPAPVSKSADAAAPATTPAPASRSPFDKLN